MYRVNLKINFEFEKKNRLWGLNQFGFFLWICQNSSMDFTEKTDGNILCGRFMVSDSLTPNTPLIQL